MVMIVQYLGLNYIYIYFYLSSVFEFKSRSGEVYSIQHYVITFVSDLRQVGGFRRVLRFQSTNKTDRHDITEILLKVALNIITLTHILVFLNCVTFKSWHTNTILSILLSVLFACFVIWGKPSDWFVLWMVSIGECLFTIHTRKKIFVWIDCKDTLI